MSIFHTTNKIFDNINLMVRQGVYGIELSNSINDQKEKKFIHILQYEIGTPNWQPTNLF